MVPPTCWCPPVVRASASTADPAALLSSCHTGWLLHVASYLSCICCCIVLTCLLVLSSHRLVVACCFLALAGCCMSRHLCCSSLLRRPLVLLLLALPLLSYHPLFAPAGFCMLRCHPMSCAAVLLSCLIGSVVSADATCVLDHHCSTTMEMERPREGVYEKILLNVTHC